MGSREISGSEHELPLFETKEAKLGKLGYRLFAGSIFVNICLIWVYRATHIPGTSSSSSGVDEELGVPKRWVWIGLLLSEVWFGLYWILTQSIRWNNIKRYTFKDRLSLRYFTIHLPLFSSFF